MKIASLFSGVGALDLGLHQVGRLSECGYWHFHVSMKVLPCPSATRVNLATASLPLLSLSLSLSLCFVSIFTLRDHY